MNSENKKPIPVIQPWTKAFWQGTKQGQLLIQVCDDCQSKIFYPRQYCPECWSGNLKWIEASGKAKVYSFTTTLDMVEPKFWDDLPYVLALVELVEGIRMMTRIVGCDPDDVQIGMDVKVVFKNLNEECALPMFTPVG